SPTRTGAASATSRPPSSTCCPWRGTPGSRRPGATRATTTGRGRRSWCARWPTAARASTSRATTARRCRSCAGPPWRGGAAMPPLTEEAVERPLAAAPGLTVVVLGDLFLDRSLDLDATLTEPSLETGLDAYQVVRVRPAP